MSAWRATLSTTEEVDMYSLLFSPTKTTFQKCGMPICKEKGNAPDKGVAFCKPCAENSTSHQEKGFKIQEGNNATEEKQVFSQTGNYLFHH